MLYVPATTLNHLFDDIQDMLKAASELCSIEPAVLQLQQPCHIFGDIHGNFSDLKYFESLLWPLGVSYTAGSFLWLGDYVDRGRGPGALKIVLRGGFDCVGDNAVCAGAASVETILYPPPPRTEISPK